jgi:hypothetical protein
MRISVALLSAVLAGALCLPDSPARSADRDGARVYSYVAPAPTARSVADYDDVPSPLYYDAPTVVVGPVYGYAPVVRGPVYGYAPVVRRRVYGYAPSVRVYGFGPVYRYAPPPAADRDRKPLGVYAPREGENLSPPRAFFRALTRESGGE